MTKSVALLATAVLSATLAPRPAEPGAGADDGPSICWADPPGVVEVVGLDPARLSTLRRLDPADPAWSSILTFRIYRAAGEPASAPIVGRHEVAGEVVRFKPRFPLDHGLSYEATYQDESDKARPPLRTRIRPEPDVSRPSPRLLAIYPTSWDVPENLLKLYLTFSNPMSRGEVYRRVHLLDAEGKAVERPFLEIGEELWDKEMTRITLLFDPGRIKRGLVPREEEGPILEAGKTYMVVVDSGWPDAFGLPIARTARKLYQAGPPDTVQPDPSRWTSRSPSPGPGSLQPIWIDFHEPMDRGMLGRAIEVRVGGEKVSGLGTPGTAERSWSFVPERSWREGPITLVIDSELEDLAGNSIARPFEVDVIRPPQPGDPGRFRTIPVPPFRDPPRR